MLLHHVGAVKVLQHNQNLERKENIMVKNKLLLALRKRYEAQKAEGLANIDVYMQNPVGIGEHSDITDAIAEQISKVAEADDALLVLEENFNEDIDK